MSMKLDAYKKASTKKDFGRVEDGTYPARVVQVVLLGTHKATDWQTGEVKTYEDSGDPILQPRVFMTYELPTEPIEIDGEDRPRWYSKEYTISAHEKAILPQVLKALGAGEDMAQAVDKPCLVTIGSTSTGKAKITGITKLMKGMEVAPLQNEAKIFDPFDPDMEVWEKLPNFIKNKVMEAEDRGQMKLFRLLDVKTTEDKADDFDDELPF